MYTKEDTQFLIENYNDNVAELAVQLGKSEKSIIGKLSKMGIYRKPEYLGKTGERPITKLELATRISERLEIPLPGLEKAPKETLRALLAGVDSVK